MEKAYSITYPQIYQQKQATYSQFVDNCCVFWANLLYSLKKKVVKCVWNVDKKTSDLNIY